MKIFPFKILVTHKIAIQMFKHNKGIIRKALTELFTLNSSNELTNEKNMMHESSKNAISDKYFVSVNI